MKRLLPVLAAAALVAVPAASAQRQAPPTMQAGSLTVGLNPPAVGFQIGTLRGNDVIKPRGFEIDLAKDIAAKLGIPAAKVKYVNIPFETLFRPGAKPFDFAFEEATITAARQKVVDFSAPYFDANQALLVQKGSGIASLEDLDGQTLGVQSGTTGKMYAEENAPEGVELKVFEDLALLLEAVKTGSIDAAINDNTVLIGYAEQNPDTEMTVEFDTGEQYGFGVEEGDPAGLLDHVNETLSKAHEDGTYEQLFKKYFPSLEVPTNLG